LPEESAIRFKLRRQPNVKQKFAKQQNKKQIIPRRRLRKIICLSSWNSLKKITEDPNGILCHAYITQNDQEVVFIKYPLWCINLGYTCNVVLVQDMELCGGLGV
jgi:hypothetical protein